MGDWIAPTGFGEFVLTVNSAGTHITKIKYTFSNYTIGSVTKNGSVSIGTTPGWLISGNQFNITNTLDPGGNEKMTVQGTFTGNGNQASGTWSALIYGTSDAGNWGPISVITDVEIEAEILLQFFLYQNYPNPFNPSTTIKFALPRTEEIKIEVFNTIGQKVATLLDKQMQIGSHEVVFDAINLPIGLYIYRIFAGKFQDVKKMLYLK